jgi:hypothetical protein
MTNNRINPDVDIVNDLLKAVLAVQPASVFINSLLFQYQERGGLSKKQLEGLHSKASKITTINPGKLATLEAIIKKKPTRYKSDIPAPVSTEVIKDNTISETIDAILAKYPQHKRVLFLKLKYNDNQLTATEIVELQKFKKLLL